MAKKMNAVVAVQGTAPATEILTGIVSSVETIESGVIAIISCASGTRRVFVPSVITDFNHNNIKYKDIVVKGAKLLLSVEYHIATETGYIDKNNVFIPHTTSGIVVNRVAYADDYTIKLSQLEMVANVSGLTGIDKAQFIFNNL